MCLTRFVQLSQLDAPYQQRGYQIKDITMTLQDAFIIGFISLSLKFSLIHFSALVLGTWFLLDRFVA
jgi:hypothetical protein